LPTHKLWNCFEPMALYDNEENYFNITVGMLDEKTSTKK
jgi:hypothetical protein